MGKSTMKIIIILIAALVIIGGVFALMFMHDNRSTPADIGDGKTISLTPGDVQQVTLSMKNYNYYPQTITVKQGIPVRLILDNSVTGCYRTFQIPTFGINRYSKSPSETIDFTPPTKGTFKFQCSMGMGYGTLIVE